LSNTQNSMFLLLSNFLPWNLSVAEIMTRARYSNT
jgi:hypothetical protein